ncbi:MAG: hypothetical protein WAM96_09410 [Candidatus Acidiferrales bacterium]
MTMDRIEQTKTCFLIASPGQQSDALRRQLQAKKIACSTIDRPFTEISNLASLKSILARSDFIACILPQNVQPNLIFELGMAIGLGKPLLLFAEGPENLPFDLKSFRALTVDLISTDALNSFLEAFLQTIPDSLPKSRTTGKVKSSHKANFWQQLRSEISVLRTSGGEGTEAKMEAALKRGFQEAGFSLTSSPERDFGADFALTSQALSKALGLPVLVEVTNNSHVPLRHSVVDRLSELLRERKGGAGLIVTYKSLESQTAIPLAQPIVIIPVDELLGWLETGSFVDEFVFAVDAFWTREQ